METVSLRGVRLSAQKGRLVADLVRASRSVRLSTSWLSAPRKRGWYHQEGAGVGHCQRRAQRRRRHRRAEGENHLRRKGMVLEALHGACAKGRGNRIVKPTCHIYLTVGNWESHGTENSSDWLPSGRHQNWSSALVRQQQGFPGMLNEDTKVREYLKRLAHASVGRVLIERPAKNARVTVYSARPGWSSARRAKISNPAQRSAADHGRAVHVSIEEIRKPEIDAQLIADSIAQQLEKRIMFRRAMKRNAQNAMRLGAQGIKVMSAGR